MSVVDLLLDGSGREEAVDRHVSALADPPSSLAALHVGARVPVGVEDDQSGKVSTAT